VKEEPKIEVAEVKAEAKPELKLLSHEESKAFLNGQLLG